MANLHVPIDIHEKLVEQFASRDARTGLVQADVPLDGLSKAVKDARVAAEALQSLSDALRTDETLPPQQSAIKLKADATRVAENVATRLDKASLDLEREITRMRQSIHAPKPPLDQHMASEVRTMLRGMKQEDRRRALRQALGDGNELFLASVLNAPALLSGLGDAELELHRSEWQRKEHPEAVTRIEKLSKAREAGKRAGNSFIGYLKDLLSSPVIKLAEKASDRTSKAQQAVSAAVGS